MAKPWDTYYAYDRRMIDVDLVDGQQAVDGMVNGVNRPRTLARTDMANDYGANEQKADSWTAGDTGTAGSVPIHDGSGNKVTVDVPVSIGADYLFTLPSTGGTDGHVLKTDGSGNTSWLNITGAGGAVNVFKTIDCPAGTDPVADVVDDTLQLLAGSNKISITGSAAADSVTYDVVEANIDHDALTNFTVNEHFTMLDEDDLVSNSATQAATQQSIKAYIDSHKNSDGSSHGYIDQSVISGASPTFDGTNFTGIPSAGVTNNISATANITDNTIVRGHGGAKVVQDTGIAIDDSDNVSGMGTLGCGGITSSGDSSFDGATVINESGADKDVRIEANGHTHAFFSQGSDGFIGINNDTPLGRLHIKESVYTSLPIIERTGCGVSGDVTHTCLSLLATKTTDMADGFGSHLYFKAQDDTSGIKSFGSIGAERDGADTQGAFVLWTVTGGVNIKRVKITHDGKIGIKTNTPSYNLHVLGTSDPATIAINGVGAVGPSFSGIRANGTVGSETAVQANNNLAIFSAKGYDGAAYSGNKAVIFMQAAENWTDTAQGTKMVFKTTDNTTTTLDTRMTIANSGLITIAQGLTVNGTTSLNNSVVINESGLDKDFRVEASGEENALFIQGNNGYAGFGTNAPTSRVQIGTGVISQQWSGLTPYVFIQGMDNEVETRALEIQDENLIVMLRISTLADSGATGGKVYMGGSLGIGETTPTARLDITSDILRLRTAKTPATAGAAGNTGDICWDANYIYVCTAASTWKRSAIAAW